MIVSEPDITTVARLLTDRSRAAMLFVLLDGQSHPATDLARIARVAPSTASSHLRRLLDAGFVTLESWGRHRYYRLASPEVSTLIESFAAVAPAAMLRSGSESATALTIARTCYDHLAGRLGVALTSALERRGAIRSVHREFKITTAGRTFFASFGIDVGSLPPRRALARQCLDWSERRPHVGGALGAAIASRCLELDWVSRQRRSRALNLTPRGRRGFADVFQVRLD